MKNTIIAVLVLLAVGVSVYVYTKPKEITSITDTSTITSLPTSTSSKSEPLAQATQKDTTKTIIGYSVKNNPITAYHFGDGEEEILFVGGIHGGYEWNTTLLAYEAMDYLQENTSRIPKNIKITIIPVLNPDGLEKVVGTTGRFSTKDVPSTESLVISGRFNANTVDLNRNFDCDWKESGVWQTKKVSGGKSAFSEPESKAVKSYIESNTPVAAVIWYSAGGGVYASQCHGDVSPSTITLMKTFASASGYAAHQSFNFYETSGDMVNWLAKNNIPAISVLLTNHSDTEWSKNKAAIEALMREYSK